MQYWCCTAVFFLFYLLASVAWEPDVYSSAITVNSFILTQDTVEKNSPGFLSAFLISAVIHRNNILYSLKNILLQFRQFIDIKTEIGLIRNIRFENLSV